MAESEESVQLRRKLLKLDKPEIAKKCKKKSLSAAGTKMDMVDRLIEYNEENGGVTGAREGSKKNTKKGDSNSGSKKKQKSGNKKSGGAGGGRSGSSKKSGGGTGGRSNNNDNNGDGPQFYCNCGGSDGDDDDDESTNNRRLFGGILGIICIILFIVAMAMNTLSRASSAEFTVTCRHHEVRGCMTDNDCIVISYGDDCDECTLNDDDECKTCDTKSGGKWWLALNIIAFIVLLVGVIGLFVSRFNEKVHGFVQWVKLFYIIAAILSFISVIAWVGANGYNQSCYDPDNDLGLGASTVIDIVNGLLLIIGALLVF